MPPATHSPSHTSCTWVDDYSHPDKVNGGVAAGKDCLSYTAIQGNPVVNVKRIVEQHLTLQESSANLLINQYSCIGKTCTTFRCEWPSDINCTCLYRAGQNSGP